MFDASYTGYPLYFKNPSGTSRGVLTEKPCWFIRLTRSDGRSGIGEVSFISGLSVEDPEEIEIQIDHVCKLVSRGEMDPGQSLPSLPGIQFALESARLDLEGGGEQLLFPSDFTEGKAGIYINGLIWMGDPGYMKRQIKEKLDAGFRVLKMKVGALETELELEVLSWIRSQFGQGDLEIRLDANGAWKPDEAPGKMEQYAPFGIHSLEQPMAPGHWEELARLCRKAPIPVALDEELIGLDTFGEGRALLETVRPSYIIVKPGLLGGFRESDQWIGLAEELGTGWWVTSALESSVGLNAISQWAFQKELSIPQGLGTGGIYRNNIPSPLLMEGNQLFFRKQQGWDLTPITQS
jgi:o-succinylbenzoate synthase